mmetsp:Transcript_36484/g.85276  ORF Transcript_36484/g.85276 Transcript_36484/m.85276 type:complete len:327 (+) Transcript_36484:54-1034(+)
MYVLQILLTFPRLQVSILHRIFHIFVKSIVFQSTNLFTISVCPIFQPFLCHQCIMSPCRSSYLHLIKCFDYVISQCWHTICIFVQVGFGGPQERKQQSIFSLRPVSGGFEVHLRYPELPPRFQNSMSLANDPFGDGGRELVQDQAQVDDGSRVRRKSGVGDVSPTQLDSRIRVNVGDPPFRTSAADRLRRQLQQRSPHVDEVGRQIDADDFRGFVGIPLRQPPRARSGAAPEIYDRDLVLAVDATEASSDPRQGPLEGSSEYVLAPVRILRKIARADGAAGQLLFERGIVAQIPFRIGMKRLSIVRWVGNVIVIVVPRIVPGRILL